MKRSKIRHDFPNIEMIIPKVLTENNANYV